MRNVIVIIGTCVVLFIACVLVLVPSELGEVQTTVSVIKSLPADWNPYQKLYDELLSPTVRINTKDGIGSGVVININTPLTSLNSTNPDGFSEREPGTGREDVYVLTAAHVVDNYSAVSVTFYTPLNPLLHIRPEDSVSEGLEGTCGEESPLERGRGVLSLSASVVMTDTNKDLALLRVLGVSAVKTAKLAPKDYTPYIFTPVWAVGCSLGLVPRPSSGHICVICCSHWEISAPILPGNSGGPVFDANTHEVIGIAVWVHTYQGQLITTMAGIVPIQTVYEFLEQSELVIK
jgi:S1-C subfamily serine protease